MATEIGDELFDEDLIYDEDDDECDVNEEEEQALLAGLQETGGDMVTTIEEEIEHTDSDLHQDSEEYIEVYQENEADMNNDPHILQSLGVNDAIDQHAVLEEEEEDEDDENGARGRDRFKSERTSITLRDTKMRPNIPDSLDDVKMSAPVQPLKHIRGRGKRKVVSRGGRGGNVQGRPQLVGVRMMNVMPNIRPPFNQPWSQHPEAFNRMSPQRHSHPRFPGNNFQLPMQQRSPMRFPPHRAPPPMTMDCYDYWKFNGIPGQGPQVSGMTYNDFTEDTFPNMPFSNSPVKRQLRDVSTSGPKKQLKTQNLPVKPESAVVPQEKKKSNVHSRISRVPNNDSVNPNLKTIQTVELEAACHSKSDINDEKAVKEDIIEGSNQDKKVFSDDEAEYKRKLEEQERRRAEILARKAQNRKAMAATKAQEIASKGVTKQQEPEFVQSHAPVPSIDKNLNITKSNAIDPQRQIRVPENQAIRLPLNKSFGRRGGLRNPPMRGPPPRPEFSPPARQSFAHPPNLNEPPPGFTGHPPLYIHEQPPPHAFDTEESFKMHPTHEDPLEWVPTDSVLPPDPSLLPPSEFSAPPIMTLNRPPPPLPSKRSRGGRGHHSGPQVFRRLHPSSEAGSLGSQGFRGPPPGPRASPPALQVPRRHPPGLQAARGPPGLQAPQILRPGLQTPQGPPPDFQALRGPPPRIPGPRGPPHGRIGFPGHASVRRGSPPGLRGPPNLQGPLPDMRGPPPNLKAPPPGPFSVPPPQRPSMPSEIPITRSVLFDQPPPVAPHNLYPEFSSVSNRVPEDYLSEDAKSQNNILLNPQQPDYDFYHSQDDTNNYRHVHDDKMYENSKSDDDYNKTQYQSDARQRNYQEYDGDYEGSEYYQNAQFNETNAYSQEETDCPHPHVQDLRSRIGRPNVKPLKQVKVISPVLSRKRFQQQQSPAMRSEVQSIPSSMNQAPPSHSSVKKRYKRVTRRNRNGDIISIKKLPIDEQGNVIGPEETEYTNENVSESLLIQKQVEGQNVPVMKKIRQIVHSPMKDSAIHSTYSSYDDDTQQQQYQNQIHHKNSSVVQSKSVKILRRPLVKKCPENSNNLHVQLQSDDEEENTNDFYRDQYPSRRVLPVGQRASSPVITIPANCTVRLSNLPPSLTTDELEKLAYVQGHGPFMKIQYDDRRNECIFSYAEPSAAHKFYNKMNRTTFRKRQIIAQMVH